MRTPGKKMPNGYYVHKKYIYVLENLYDIDVSQYIKKIPAGFQYTIVKYNTKTRDITFTYSPDWDTADEPIVGDAILVRKDGSTRFIKQHKDPWIYHHKWMFVADDYVGFDVEKSKQRSKEWVSIPGINKSKIGKLSYWEGKILTVLTDNQQKI